MAALPQVAELKSLLTDQPAMPLRPDQVDEYQDEHRRLTGMAQGRDMDGNPNQTWLPANRGLASRTASRVKKILDEQAPKKITDPKRRDRVAALVQELEQTVIAPALLPVDVMRRNPAGAVGQVLKREMSREFKDLALTVRRGIAALDPDDRDPDARGYERLRRESATEGAASFMAGAQIPGNFGMTPQAKANWPLGEPTADTAIKQASRAEKSRASLAKARAARAAKKAGTAGPGIQANGSTGEGA